MVTIKNNICISDDELVFRFSRSSGPGGQNVNKVSTKTTVSLDVANCRGLSDNHRRQILNCLSSRVCRDGILQVTCQKYRTQKANRAAAVERLIDILRKALEPKIERKKTKMPRAAHEKRLRAKKCHSALKSQRAGRDFE